MTTVLFVSHPEKECGVHQFGKLVFLALAASQKYEFKYREVSSSDEVCTAVAETAADVVLVNWHPLTMRWAQQSAFWSFDMPVVGIIHEANEEIGNLADNTQFDYYITHDPSARFSSPIYFGSARPIPPFEGHANVPPRLTIGSFGFATPGKGFEALVARVNAEFDDCVIRLNIPYSHFCDPDGVEARAVADRCRGIISKPGVELEISHQFMAMDGVLSFLAGNSMNAFFYETQRSYGISSTTDLAIAAGRPIALKRSSMFRHMYDCDPSLFVEHRSLREILSDGDRVVSAYRQRWSADQVRKDYEAMLEKVLLNWSSLTREQIRRQWMRRVVKVQADEWSAAARGELAGAAKVAADQAKERISSLQTAFQVTEEALRATEVRLESLYATYLLAEGRAERAAAAALSARNQVKKPKARSKRIKRSFSWRITRPIRITAKCGKRLLRALRS